jgi:hypothetical protein
MLALNKACDEKPCLMKVRLYTLCGSLLLSLLAIWQSDVVGRDGVLYLQTARVFLEGGIQEASNLYSWLFYPVLIAGVHKLTSFSLENSAYLLNTVLIIVLTDTFVRLYQEVNPNAKYFRLSSVVILAFSGLNDYRVEVMRGWGFLAFSLLAFLYFLRFMKNWKSRDALLWQLFILLAVLFRKEACVYMLLVPFLILLAPHSERKLFDFLKANFLIFVVLIASLMGSLIFENYFISKLYSALSRYLVSDGPWANFLNYARSMSQNVLTQYSADYAPLMLAAGIFVLIAYKILTKVGGFSF